MAVVLAVQNFLSCWEQDEFICLGATAKKNTCWNQKGEERFHVRRLGGHTYMAFAIYGKLV